MSGYCLSKSLLENNSSDFHCFFFKFFFSSWPEKDFIFMPLDQNSFSRPFSFLLSPCVTPTQQLCFHCVHVFVKVRYRECQYLWMACILCSSSSCAITATHCSYRFTHSRLPGMFRRKSCWVTTTETHYMLEHPSPSPHMLLFSGVNVDPENMACKIEWKAHSAHLLLVCWLEWV